MADQPPTTDPKLSRFLKDTLTPGETVMFEAKFHWFYNVASVVILAMWIGGGMLFTHWLDWTAINVFGPKTPMSSAGIYPFIEKLKNIPAFLCMAFGLSVVAKRSLVQLTTEAVVTSKRLLFKRGIFSVQAAKMSLKELNYAEVKQSLLGNLLGYGGLHIYTFTLDDKNISIPDIANPSGFIKALDAAKADAGLTPDRSAMPPGSMGHAPGAGA